MSVGIDPLSAKSKICNFDCVYCQLGKTAHFVTERKEFISVRDLMREVAAFNSEQIDHWTFSGRGEPTLAKNLGEMIKALRDIRDEKIAVITNASLMHRRDVQKDLSLADCVLAKLDASSQKSFETVGQTPQEMKLASIVEGIWEFRQSFKGKLALQIMFIEQNKKYASSIAQIARDIHPDEVQLNTPLRACAVKPLSVDEMNEIRVCFQGLPTVSVYDKEIKNIGSMNLETTVARHGFYGD